MASKHLVLRVITVGANAISLASGAVVLGVILTHGPTVLSVVRAFLPLIPPFFAILLVTRALGPYSDHHWPRTVTIVANVLLLLWHMWPSGPRGPLPAMGAIMGMLNVIPPSLALLTLYLSGPRETSAG